MWDVFVNFPSSEEFLIEHEKNPLDDLRVLADKQSLQFVMKDGMIAACHAGNELPKELFAKQVLSI